MRRLLLVLVVSCCAKPAAEAPAPVVEAEAPAPTPKPVPPAKVPSAPAIIGNPGNLRNFDSDKFKYAFASDVEKTYAGNVFKGEKKYKDQLVTLILRVKEVRSALGNPAIMSEGYGQLSQMTGGVRAILADDLVSEELDMLADLDPGDLIALRCRGAGMTLATPHFRDCVPRAVPTLPAVHAARALYVCVYMRMLDIDVSAHDGGVEIKEEMAEAALVARERMDRDGMATIEGCASKDAKMPNGVFLWACEESPKAPECAGFATEANKEVRSLEDEALKRLKKSR